MELTNKDMIAPALPGGAAGIASRGTLSMLTSSFWREETV